MKRLLLSLSVIAMLGMAGSAAFAQGTDDFDKELQTFQKKTAADGTGDAAPAANVPPSASPPSAAAAVGNPSPAVGSNAGGTNKSNPLGPAGNLPLGKQMPATAKALDMQMPVETPEQMEAEAAAQKKKMDAAVFDDALKTSCP